jgi:hypothetical protein
MPKEIDLNSKVENIKPTNVAHSPDLSDETSGLTNEQLLQYYLHSPEDKFNPWEETTLPSRGIYYDWPDGVVQVKAMGTAAEKVLANQRLAQDGQSIDYLFRECVRLQNNMDPTELLIGDRVFLLFYLRGITHGNMYEFVLTCPNDNCKESSTHEYDLNNLAETIIYADPGLGQEPFELTLPHISSIFKRDIKVGLRFLRAIDLNDMMAKRRARKKMFSRPGIARNKRDRNISSPAETADDMITDNLAKMIVNIAGVSDMYVIQDFVDKMHSRDSAEIREWMRDHTPGIDNTITIECPKCGNEYNVELPITEGFFRPAKSARM